jgi:N-carbamoyl-L-amino-acid hydrolase
MALLSLSKLDSTHVFAKVGVPTGMIFVRNQNGSHSADEAMSLDDFAVGTRALLVLLQELAE